MNISFLDRRDLENSNQRYTVELEGPRKVMKELVKAVEEPEAAAAVAGLF